MVGGSHPSRPGQSCLELRGSVARRMRMLRLDQSDQAGLVRVGRALMPSANVRDDDVATFVVDVVEKAGG